MWFNSSPCHLLYPWIAFTTIISAWWFQTSSKLAGKKSENQPENLETINPKTSAICPKYSSIIASVALKGSGKDSPRAIQLRAAFLDGVIIVNYPSLRNCNKQLILIDFFCQ